MLQPPLHSSRVSYNRSDPIDGSGRTKKSVIQTAPRTTPPPGATPSCSECGPRSPCGTNGPSLTPSSPTRVRGNTTLFDHPRFLCVPKMCGVGYLFVVLSFFENATGLGCISLHPDLLFSGISSPFRNTSDPCSLDVGRPLPEPNKSVSLHSDHSDHSD